MSSNLNFFTPTHIYSNEERWLGFYFILYFSYWFGHIHFNIYIYIYSYIYIQSINQTQEKGKRRKTFMEELNLARCKHGTISPENDFIFYIKKKKLYCPYGSPRGKFFLRCQGSLSTTKTLGLYQSTWYFGASSTRIRS